MRRSCRVKDLVPAVKARAAGCSLARCPSRWAPVNCNCGLLRFSGTLRPVAELGSIYEQGQSSGKRGRDLHADVEVPAWALGCTDGVEIEVPVSLPCHGEQVRRACLHGPGLTVHLPDQFPDGAALRMRGEGEASPEGPNGDLLLHMKIDRSQTHAPALDPAAQPSGNLMMVAALVSLSVAAAVIYALAG